MEKNEKLRIVWRIANPLENVADKMGPATDNIAHCANEMWAIFFSLSLPLFSSLFIFFVSPLYLSLPLT